MSKELILNPDDPFKKYVKFFKKKDGSDSNMALLSGDILPTKCNYDINYKMRVITYGNIVLLEGGKLPNNSEYTIKKIYYSDQLEKYILELIKN